MENVQILAEQLGRLLYSQSKTLATLESCTGGLIAAALTDIPGSSSWFEGGLVVYSNQLKQHWLDVKETTLLQHGAVSEVVVSEMLQGALALNIADCYIAISGIAGPSGATPDKPVGTVFIGWAVEGRISVQHYLFSGSRMQVRQQSVVMALDELLVRLQTR